MYGFIFGFHRLARWPKCTPASIRSFTISVTADHLSLVADDSGPIPPGERPGAALLESLKRHQSTSGPRGTSVTARPVGVKLGASTQAGPGKGAGPARPYGR